MNYSVVFVCTLLEDVDVSLVPKAMMEASGRSVCFDCEAVLIFDATIHALAKRWSGKQILKDMCQPCAVNYERQLMEEEKASGSTG